MWNGGIAWIGLADVSIALLECLAYHCKQHGVAIGREPVVQARYVGPLLIEAHQCKQEHPAGYLLEMHPQHMVWKQFARDLGGLLQGWPVALVKILAQRLHGIPASIALHQPARQIAGYADQAVLMGVIGLA